MNGLWKEKEMMKGDVRTDSSFRKLSEEDRGWLEGSWARQTLDPVNCQAGFRVVVRPFCQ